MVLRVLLVFQDQCLQPMASSSLDTARVRMCPTVPMEPTSSMMATPCCTCRATKGHMDRTSVWVYQSFTLPGSCVTLCIWPSSFSVLWFRLSRQLSAQVQHHALHVLQHQQRLQLCLPQRLLLLAVYISAHAHVNGPHHWREHQALHQQVAMERRKAREKRLDEERWRVFNFTLLCMCSGVRCVKLQPWWSQSTVRPSRSPLVLQIGKLCG